MITTLRNYINRFKFLNQKRENLIAGEYVNAVSFLQSGLAVKELSSKQANHPKTCFRKYPNHLTRKGKNA